MTIQLANKVQELERRLNALERAVDLVASAVDHIQDPTPAIFRPVPRETYIPQTVDSREIPTLIPEKRGPGRPRKND